MSQLVNDGVLDTFTVGTKQTVFRLVVIEFGWRIDPSIHAVISTSYGIAGYATKTYQVSVRMCLTSAVHCPEPHFKSTKHIFEGEASFCLSQTAINSVECCYQISDSGGVPGC
jgi:hypothetical protein